MATWSCKETKEVKCPHCGTTGIVPVWIKPIDLPIKCYNCKQIFEEEK